MTPLKNWGTIAFIGSVILFSLAAFMGSLYRKAVKSLFPPDDETLAFIIASAILAAIGAMYLLVLAVAFNCADTLLGDTFPKCPLCFSPNLSFDIKVGTRTDRVVCRNCQAEWKFRLTVWGQLTRLWLVEGGNVLGAKPKVSLPNTESPEEWREWARERFRQAPPAQAAPTAASPADAVFCRFCGHRNLPDAHFCSACGKELNT